MRCSGRPTPTHWSTHSRHVRVVVQLTSRRDEFAPIRARRGISSSKAAASFEQMQKKLAAGRAERGRVAAGHRSGCRAGSTSDPRDEIDVLCKGPCGQSQD